MIKEKEKKFMKVSLEMIKENEKELMKGEFKNDKKEGKGIYKYADGDFTKASLSMKKRRKRNL